MLTEYETTVVIRPDISGDVIETTLDRIREALNAQGGKLLAINHWGKKKLAYEISKHARGIYVHTQYLGKQGTVAEIERNLRISDNVLRFLTVKIAEDVGAEARQPQQYVRPEYDAAEEREEEQQQSARPYDAEEQSEEPAEVEAPRAEEAEEE